MSPSATKVCKRCKKELPLEKFGYSYHARDHVKTVCEDCLTGQNRKERPINEIDWACRSERYYVSNRKLKKSY